MNITRVQVRRAARYAAALLLLLSIAPGCKTTPSEPADPEAEAIRQRAQELEAQREARLAEMNRRGGASDVVMSVPPGNVRVNLERVSFDRRERQSLDAMIGYRDRNVDVQVGGTSRHNGLAVYALQGGWRGAISVGGSTRTSRSISSQFILLAPGGTASLEAVTLQPRPWVVVVPTWRGGVLVSRSQYDVTGSGMAVTVRGVSASGVDVELLPYFHAARTTDARGGRGGAIQLDELRTRVIVPPGVPIAVMSDSSATTDTARSWLSYRRDDRVTDTLLVLTVDVPR
ncbi:MAG: hypothetical protein GC159_22210 [Phycisphaera sp.]|nr:hypothetical protein [Phycisphaera sp.]